MTRFYIYRDGKEIASTATRLQAVQMIRRYQKEETHPILKAGFSIIEGEQEYIDYPKCYGKYRLETRYLNGDIETEFFDKLQDIWEFLGCELKRERAGYAGIIGNIEYCVTRQF